MSGALLALFAAVRGTVFLSLLFLVGAQTAAQLIRRNVPPEALELIAPWVLCLRRIARPATAALIIALFAKGALQLWSFHDPGEPITPDMITAVLLTGTWGTAWLLELAAAIFFFAWCRWRDLRLANAAWVPLLLTIVLLWAQSGMGHAAGRNWPGLTGRLVDTIHLSALGTWLGTLAALAMIAFPALEHDDQLPTLALIVRAFSNYARAGVALVVTTGVIMTLVYAGSLATVLDSTWGRLLAIKLLLMIGVLLLGWYNWRVVTPALIGADTGARRTLRRAVRAELALGLAMLLITAFLVASPLPGEG